MLAGVRAGEAQGLKNSQNPPFSSGEAEGRKGFTKMKNSGIIR